MTICVHPRVGELCIDWSRRSYWPRYRWDRLGWALIVWHIGIAWVPLGLLSESLWRRVRSAWI